MPIHANGMKATPLVVNGVTYISRGLDEIVALDPVTGTTKWVYNPEAYKDGAQADVLGWISRGVAYRAMAGDERILFGTLDGYLIALNAKTGQPIASFGMSGKADLTREFARQPKDAASGRRRAASPSVDSPPVVVRDTVIVGSSMSDRTPIDEWPPGYVEAFDVSTGTLNGCFTRLRVMVIRCRHLGDSCEPLHRQRERLVDAERRRRPRPGLPADDDTEQR